MTLAHGSGLSRYDELGVVVVLLVVLVLAVLQVRHVSRARAAEADAGTDSPG